MKSNCRVLSDEAYSFLFGEYAAECKASDPLGRDFVPDLEWPCSCDADGQPGCVHLIAKELARA